MTREAFIRKWLANKDFQYCEDGRAQMREDLDKVIYHAQQKLNIASVSGSGHFVSQSCQGEKCFCGDKATHKLGEEIQHDEPNRIRHNLTAYVCCQHFQMVLGKAACASGAVDKTVSGDFSCGCKTPNDCKELTNCALHNKYGRA